MSIQYQIIKNLNENEKISGLHYEINSRKRAVSLDWTWPEDGSIKYALVFKLQVQEKVPLELLLKRGQCKLCLRGEGKRFEEEIRAEGVDKYAVYPCRSVGQINQVLQQQEGNEILVHTRKHRITWGMKEKFIPWTDYKRVTLSIHTSSNLSTEVLCYTKYRKGTTDRICYYPLNREFTGGFTRLPSVFLAKNEVLHVEINDAKNLTHMYELEREE